MSSSKLHSVFIKAVSLFDIRVLPNGKLYPTINFIGNPANSTMNKTIN